MSEKGSRESNITTILIQPFAHVGGYFALIEVITTEYKALGISPAEATPTLHAHAHPDSLEKNIL